MDKKRLLERTIEAQNGFIHTKTVSSMGIPRGYLTQMVAEGKLERIGRGEYLSPEGFDDVMFRLQSKYGRAIFSHDTALFLHDLSDRDPLIYSVTVPSGYNAGKLKGFPASVFFINSELYTLGIEITTTDFGNNINCYNAERALCDVVRNRNVLDISDISASIKSYISRKNKNIPRLMEYAEMFRIKKQMRSYLEVLI